jgi:UPF0755 protein
VTTDPPSGPPEEAAEGTSFDQLASFAIPPDGDEEDEEPEPGEPRIYGSAGRSGPESRVHRRRRRRWRLVVAGAAAVVVLVVVGGILWIRAEADPSGPRGAQVIVTVRSGTGVSRLAGTLQSDGVIGSSLAYRLWSQFHTVPGVRSGAYAFNKNSAFAQVNDLIAAGPNVFPLVIPAGFTVSEVAARVGQLPGHDAATFAKVAASGVVRSPWQPAGSTTLDGLLGTGTYTVVPGETDTALLTDMVDRFNGLAGRLGLGAGAARLGYTPYQVITVASIVEKEGVIQKNLGPVARVIYNRLANHMPLQMNSTVLYAEGRDGGQVTDKDLQLKTPYNTYLNKGLTPTPICFPSPAALQAALHPPAGSWLYFVLIDQDGTEAFADTFAQQEANEALAQERGLP